MEIMNKLSNRVALIVTLITCTFFLEGCCLSKEEYDVLKCDVCMHAVDRFKFQLLKISPTKKVEGTGYQIGKNGERVKNQVPTRSSEIHITDMMDTFCNNLDEYAFGTSKITGERRLIKIINNEGQMNPVMNDYNIEDINSNQIIPDYCREFLGDHDDDLMKYLKSDLSFESLKFCQDVAGLCSENKKEVKTEL